MKISSYPIMLLEVKLSLY